MRKDRSLKTVSDAGHAYEQPGIYTACVKACSTRLIHWYKEVEHDLGIKGKIRR